MICLHARLTVLHKIRFAISKHYALELSLGLKVYSRINRAENSDVKEFGV